MAIDRYNHDGKLVQANTSTLTVPVAIAASILTVTGIDTTPRIVKHHSAPPPPGFANARPCSLSYGQLLASKQADFKTPLPKFRGKTLPYSVCGYTGPQLRSAYEDSLSAGLDSDFLATLAQVVDQNKVQIISNSWGDLEANTSTDSIAAYQEVFIQGALQGISFMFSSGDNGDELDNTGVTQADYPASDPYITSVGGMSDAIGADGTFTFQTGWGTQRAKENATQTGWDLPAFLYGAGGGSSALFNQPVYQDGVVPASFGDVRSVPDVGLDADPTTGMLIGETQTFPEGVRYGEYRIGGTSLASPLFAGMTALTLQHAGGALGFLNPTIYGQSGKGTFSDIKGSPADAGNVRVDFVNGVNQVDGLAYTVRTFNQDSSLRVTRGWDDVTGIGSPNARWITSVPRH